MEVWINILGVIVFCAIAAVAIYYGHLAAKKRRDELSAFAREVGWHFNPNDDPSHDEQYGQFEIFSRGHSRRAYNTLTGSISVRISDGPGMDFPGRMGDYLYKITTHSGKSTSTRTYRFSYLILHLPFAHLPALFIRPEGFFDKVAGALGFDDIDFESEEFSRRFHVKSPDKKFAYDVCDPRMMEFLLQTAPPTAIDIERGCCCLSEGNRCWEPAQFRQMLAWAQEFFERWPAHVVKELSN